MDSKSSSLSGKQRRILAYLWDHVDDQTYFKSGLIGQKLDMSAKEVGSNIAAIADHEHGLEIEKWGYSSSTTWKVTDKTFDKEDEGRPGAIGKTGRYGPLCEPTESDCSR